MKNRIVDYTVICKTNQIALEKEVKEKIGVGWQPLGAVSVASVSGFLVQYAQGMVKYQSED